MPPRHTTRERRMYVAAAQLFRAAFRDLYLFPLHSRRRFRTSCDFHDDDDTIRQLSYYPTLFGPCHAGEDADSTPAHAAALVYFTMRRRRPRVLLMEVARAIRSELERRDAAARLSAAQGDAHQLAHEYECLRQPREEARKSLRDLIHTAGHVYDEPRRALRLLLHSVRRHGAEHTRAILAKRPEAFGRLIRSPDYRWLKVIPVPTAAEARNELPRFLRCFEASAAKRSTREKAGPTALALARMEAAGAALEGLRYPRHSGDPMKEAARVLAILYRRRAVDDTTTRGRKLPPKIDRQLAAMLPPEAAPLIREAIRESAKHSGEDPIWIHGNGDVGRGERQQRRRPGPGLDI